MRALLLLLVGMPLRGGDDVNAILRRLVEAEERNDHMARQYTYLEDAAWFSFDKHGELHRNRSETHEVIFVEGLKYRKLIARNGKPLSAHEAAEVDKEMRETADERRKHPQPAPGGMISFGEGHADLGSLAELLTLFDNRLAGEETVGDRRAWVVESAPRTDRTPLTRHEKQVCTFRKKLWIDESEFVLLRSTATVGPAGLYGEEGEFLASPGSSLVVESAKIHDGVWEPIHIVLDISRPFGKTIRPAGRTEYRQSRFQKFAVESTITVEPPK